ncbi:hypothetical protein [Parageobacillus sp. G301]|jgi:hypothetical protein|nr:hypothetical protein [Parageobacillus sp. G301]GLH62988.1 hypothetical protein PG301_08270 [Parageobacillus sp. G301]
MGIVVKDVIHSGRQFFQEEAALFLRAFSLEAGSRAAPDEKQSIIIHFSA